MSGTRTSRHFMERRSATHVYFLTGPGSNWFPGAFRQRLSDGGPLLTFCCREQYLMARKKHVSGDPAGVEAVMAAAPPDMGAVSAAMAADPRGALKAFHAYPREHKRVGRTPPYDDAAWMADREHAAFAAIVADAAQNPAMGAWLDGTGGRTLVEGSPKDTTWGVGLAWDDPRILDASNWRGLNLLGIAHMRVRAFRARAAALAPPPA